MVSLNGFCIVVTRPRASAEATARALEAAHAQVLVMPLLAIEAKQATETGLTVPPDAIIFVSSHAAEFGVPALSAQRLIANRSAGQRVYAVGRVTAARLAALGLGNVSIPESGEDSEALLAEAFFLAAVGKTVLIVRGDSDGGGRQLLAETLTARGASVVQLICYQRQACRLDPADSAKLGAAVRGGAAVLVGSVETLESLATNLIDQTLTLADVAHLLVPHARVAAAARVAGARRVTVVSLEDNKLIETLAKIGA